MSTAEPVRGVPSGRKESIVSSTHTMPREASWLGRRLASIGGMRPELVDEYSGERRDFVQMALILFVTALEATIAGAFAVNMAFSTIDGGSPAAWVVVVSGIVWGFIIFNIDRYMVLGMEGMHGTRALWPALIRGVLAALIGLVMATPLVLQVFNSEIEAEIVRINAARGQESQQQNEAPAEAKVKEKEKVVASRRLELEVARSGTNLEKNPVYQAARKAWDNATNACTAAQSKATRELRGELPKSDGGSGRPGASEIYRTFQRQADEKCGFASDKSKELGAAKRAATLSPQEIQGNVAAAESALRAAESDLSVAREALDAARQGTGTIASGYGLLIRLEALHNLSRVPLLGFAHFTLAALLMSIEILPVFFKTIKQWNHEPTAYEDAWKGMDRAARLRGEAIEEHTIAAARAVAEAPVSAAREHARTQRAVNVHMAREIAGVQLAVMQRRLAEWAQGHRVTYRPTDLDVDTAGDRTMPPDEAEVTDAYVGVHAAGAAVGEPTAGQAQPSDDPGVHANGARITWDDPTYSDEG